jgi:uncharacterized membrane protein YphA (DoxX/SURF4 family)
VQDRVVLSPAWPWRLLRMPELQIPLTEVEGISRITFGIKFDVPDNPALDGTRFKRWYGGRRKLEALVESMQSRGIAVETMPLAERARGFARDLAVAQRPGWIWRDRGRLAFLESGVALALGLVILLVTGFFTDPPAPVLGAFAFVVAVVVCAWFAGHRRRSRARERV